MFLESPSMKERNLLLEDSSYMALLMRFREKSCGRTTRANSRFVDEFPRFTFVELRSVPYVFTASHTLILGRTPSSCKLACA